jgi:hypothetical protein
LFSQTVNALNPNVKSLIAPVEAFPDPGIVWGDSYINGRPTQVNAQRTNPLTGKPDIDPNLKTSFDFLGRPLELTQTVNGAPTTTTLSTGTPNPAGIAEAICEEARRGADIILVGSGEGLSIGGPIVEQLVAEAPCHVAIMKAPAVGNTRLNWNRVESNNFVYSSTVRCRASPKYINMIMSMRPTRAFGSQGMVSISITSNRSVGRMASRHRRRISRHFASGQSCRTWLNVHTSPVAGIVLKKFPARSSQRSLTPRSLNTRSASGRSSGCSTSIPRILGRLAMMAASKDPIPPPTSTTVFVPVQS